VVLVLNGNAAIQSNSDWRAFREEWQTSMVTATAEAKMPFVFAKSEEPLDANAGTLVRVKVNNFRYISQTTRFMVGVLAGNATMDVDVEYLELPSKKPLGSKKFNTSTSAWEGIFSAATPKQVQAVSAQIVKDVATPVATK